MSQSVIQDGKIFVGKSMKPEYLELRFANRHGLITGATGTGKTVTLQGLAEGFSQAGVPVFASDIKGDLSGIAAVGEPKDFLVKRAAEVGLGSDWQQRAFPTDLLGRVRQAGSSDPCHRPRHGTAAALAHARTVRGAGRRAQHRLPRRRRREDPGPRPQGPPRHPRKRVRALERADREIRQRRHHLGRSRFSAGLLVLEEQGAGQFFGEPALDIKDFMRIAPDGRGVISILTADKLMESAASLLHVPALDADQALADSCPRSVTCRSRSSSSSSTRRICCSTARPRPCSSASSRSPA